VKQRIVTASEVTTLWRCTNTFIIIIIIIYYNTRLPLFNQTLTAYLHNQADRRAVCYSRHLLHLLYHYKYSNYYNYAKNEECFCCSELQCRWICISKIPLPKFRILAQIQSHGFGLFYWAPRAMSSVHLPYQTKQHAHSGPMCHLSHHPA